MSNTHELKASLKKLNIERSKKYVVGKELGSNLWVHKSCVFFLEEFSEIYSTCLTVLPDDFVFDVVRFSKDKTNVTFISSPDFAISREPIVSDSYKVYLDDGNNWCLSKLTKKAENTLIYHHKWMFVDDSSMLFCVKTSMERSLAWKSILGANSHLSSRIGRITFWDNWLVENKLTGRFN